MRSAFLARHGGRLDHGAARRVRRHAIEDPGIAIAERAAHPGDLVGVAVQRAAHHQKNAFGLIMPGLLGESLGGPSAECHRLHFAKGNPPSLRHGPSSLLSC